jgi:hypothetical protein
VKYYICNGKNPKIKRLKSKGTYMAELNMFNFLREGAPSKSVDLEVLKEFSKQAASDLLGSDSTPLNYSIQKIAKVENLVPGHIDIVCQEANRAVQSELFKTAKDHYTDFELADPSVIISNLDTAVQKTAGLKELSDFDLPPSQHDSRHSIGDFSLSKTAGHAGLADTSKHSKQKEIEKTAAQFRESKEELLIIDAQIQSLENKFVKIAREQLIPSAFKERAADGKQIALFCKEAGLDLKQTNHLMGLLDYVLKGQGLIEKTADLKADEKYISENLNAKIVNGTHPLYITIKTLVDKNQRKEALENNHNIIKTKLEDYRASGAVLGQVVREL